MLVSTLHSLSLEVHGYLVLIRIDHKSCLPFDLDLLSKRRLRSASQRSGDLGEMSRYRNCDSRKTAVINNGLKRLNAFFASLQETCIADSGTLKERLCLLLAREKSRPA